MASASEHKVIINAQDNASSTLKKVEGNFESLGSLIKKAAAAVGAFELAKGVIKLGSQAEQAAISFETLLKSGTKAAEMMKDIEDFASRTPFDNMGLTEGVQKLLGFGIAAERALPTMQVLGDAIVAVGLGQEDLNGVVLALGQIQAKGKLSMEETLQIAERGLPIFDILREQLGLTQEQIGNLGNEGIKSSVAIDAILTGLNQRFAGAMEKQSKTLAGQWSTAMRNVKNAATSIVAPVNTALTSGLATVNSFFKENDKTIKEIGGRITETFVDLLTAGAATFGGIAGSAGIAFDAITDDQAESGNTWMENFRIVQDVLSKALAGILITANTAIQSVFGAAAMGFNALRLVGQTVAAFVVGTVGEAVNLAIGAFNKLGKRINLAAEKMGVSFRVSVIDNISLADKAAKGLRESWAEGFSAMDSTQAKFAENLGKSNAAIYDSLFKSVDDYDKKLKTSNDTASKGPSVLEKNLEMIKKIQETLNAGKSDMFTGAGGGGKKSGKSESEKMKEEIDKTKDSASELYSTLEEQSAKHLEKVSELRLGYSQMKDRLAEMVSNGRQQVKTLNEAFADMGAKFSEEIGKMKEGLKSLDKDAAADVKRGLTDIAERAVEVQTQLAEARKKLSEATTGEGLEEARQRVKLLEDELSLAKTKVSDADIQKAKEYLEKGETQRIIDRMAAEKDAYEEKRKALEDKIAKMTAAHEMEMAQFREKSEFKKKQMEDEIADYQRQMRFKRNEIDAELSAYQNVVAQKKALDDAYFANFSKQITAQASALDSVLAKMAQAGIAGGSAVSGKVEARADGGRVSPGQAYVVGENRPELFVPDRPGTVLPSVGGGGVTVNLNMGGVTVRSESDVRSLASAIKDELVREIRLAKLGIA